MRDASLYSIKPNDQLCSLPLPGLSNQEHRCSEQFLYTENAKKYIWGRPITRMLLEVQCLAVALVVTSQVWILSYYGIPMFESLIGNNIMLPLLYLIGVIVGTLTYVRPTYWRIASALTVYSVVIYFSVLATTYELQFLMTPTLAELMQSEPMNTGVWIPWAIGFAFHLHICITSGVISLISVRDMYFFEPVVINSSKKGATTTTTRGSLVFNPRWAVSSTNSSKAMVQPPGFNSAERPHGFSVSHV